MASACSCYIWHQRRSIADLAMRCKVGYDYNLADLSVGRVYPTFQSRNF